MINGPEVYLTRPDEYAGQSELLLGTEALEGASARSWAAFLSSGPIAATTIVLRGRATQDLLESLSPQEQLETLEVKFGSYADLEVIRKLPKLTKLSLRGATKVTAIDALASAAALMTLVLDETFLLRDLSPLAALVHLRDFSYGNGYPGNNKPVEVGTLEWVRSLTELERLSLPGTRLLDPDLSVLAELPRLKVLSLPLRRNYRKQVFALAEHNEAFASVAREYLGYDDLRAKWKV